MEEVEEYVNPIEFEPCGICGRTFRPDVLMKHTPICQKSNAKKRKAFDSTKQRAIQEAASVRRRPEPKKSPPKSNWREKHEHFMASLKAARGVSHAMKTGAPLPPPPKAAINPDYVQCPTCERRFNSSAAERHIPWCAEKAKRIHPNSKAEQLKQRTQYKPPLPGGKKPSGVGTRTNSGGHRTTATSNKSMTNGRVGSGGGLSNGYSSSMSSAGRRPSLENVNRTRGTGRQPYGYEDETDSDSMSPKSFGRVGSGDSYRSSGSSGNRGIRSKPPSGTSHRDTVIKRTPTPPSYGKLSSLNRQPSMENVNGRRASKFCYECGTKYPVPHAKFCCECGIKRVWIE